MVHPSLKEHFLKYFWPFPNENNNRIIRPQRVYKPEGVINHFKMQGSYYKLPLPNRYFHVYQIGDTSPTVLNLKNLHWTDRTDWIRLDTFSVKEGLSIIVYTDKGIRIPLSNVYYTVTLEGNLTFSYLIDSKIDYNPIEDLLDIKVYRYDTYYEDRRNYRKGNVDIFTVKYSRTNDIIEMDKFINKYIDKSGKIIAYVNGIMVDKTSLRYVKNGDVVELVYEEDLFQSIEILLNQTPSFKSERDGIRKYIFTHNQSNPQNKYEYFDDTEFFLKVTLPDERQSYYGFYLNKNHKSQITQLGGADYAISTELVDKLIQHNDLLKSDGGRLSLIAFYRKQKRDKRYPYNHNRTHVLNKLSFTDRVSNLIGSGSYYPLWRAGNQDNGVLNTCILYHVSDLTTEQLEGVYGYNAMSYYMGYPTIMRKDFKSTQVNGSTHYTVDIPPAYRMRCTIFEYNAEGHLLNFRLSSFRDVYSINHKDCHYVEFVSGHGSVNTTDVVGVLEAPIGDFNEYRVYAIEKNNVEDNSLWVDVTGEKDLHGVVEKGGKKYVVVEGNKRYPTTQYMFYIRNDSDFMCITADVKPIEGNYKYTFNSSITLEDKRVRSILKIPYGTLDVFLNGKCLIEGVDYFVNFPGLYLCNKEHLDYTRNGTQRLVIRYMNFPVTETTANGPILKGISDNRQVGYVRNGMLSLNGTYNLMDDKCLMFKVNGKFVDKSELGFSEDNTQIKVGSDRMEGKPYEIHEMIVPKRDLYTKDTYQYRQDAIEWDKQLSTYIGKYHKDKPVEKEIKIINLYTLFSPVLSRILDDMVEGHFTENSLNVSDLVKYVESQYGNLFKFDPYIRMGSIHLQNCDIHPTWKRGVVTLPFKRYSQLEKICKTYFKDKVDLSTFVNVGL